MNEEKGYLVMKSTQLFLSNVNFDLQESELKIQIETAGHVVEDIKLLTDRDTGRPRGIGFVTIQHPDEVTSEEVIKDLDGLQIMNRPLRAVLARPREQKRRDRRDKGQNRYNYNN